VEWVSLLNSFKDAGPAEYYTDNDVNLFKAGKAGIIIDGSWNTAGLAEAIGADNLAVDPWPKGMSGYVQTENIYLNANAKGDEMAAGWAFMQYFLGKDAQTAMVTAGHIPAIAGITISDPLMNQAVQQFQNGTAFPVIPEMSAYFSPMDTALQSVFNAGADPAAALKTANDTITAAVQKIRAGQ